MPKINSQIRLLPPVLLFWPVEMVAAEHLDPLCGLKQKLDEEKEHEDALMPRVEKFHLSEAGRAAN